MTIKAIAFDLGGVFLQENDFPLSQTEDMLERQFGKINSNNEYYVWARQATNLLQEEVEQMTGMIIRNIYDMRDPEIFNQLPELKFAIASNHLSAMNIRIDDMELRPKFDTILISADIGIAKPQKAFYERLMTELKEKPQDILFIDDNEENIESAKKVGLKTLLYNHTKNLTHEILKYLETDKST